MKRFRNHVEVKLYFCFMGVCAKPHTNHRSIFYPFCNGYKYFQQFFPRTNGRTVTKGPSAPVHFPELSSNHSISSVSEYTF